MNRTLAKALPVIFGFFVMGFCDVVGIATSYIKNDFGLSETIAGFIPSMVFIWFLVLSIPSAMAMNRFGRKTMVQVSNIVTFVGMLLPFISYSFFTCMTGFVLLGIGNTILQVSLNPLLTNVISRDKLTSMLTVGQVVKAVSSFCGPFIAAFAASAFGAWQYLFPIYAAITLLSSLWLMLTEIPKETEISETSSMSAAFGLLKDKAIYTIFNAGWIGQGRGDVGDGIGKSDAVWDRYLNAYKVVDDDTAGFWGAKNLGRFANDQTPANLSKNYGKEIEALRADLRKKLDKVFGL